MAETAVEKSRELTYEDVERAAKEAVRVFNARRAYNMIRAGGNPAFYKNVDDVLDRATEHIEHSLKLYRDGNELPVGCGSGWLKAEIREEIDGFVTVEVGVDANCGTGFYNTKGEECGGF